MPELFRTAHVIFTREPREPFARMARTSEPIRTAVEVQQIATLLERAIPRSERAKIGILSDLRDAPMRNDPGFEEAIAPRVVALSDGFARHAILIRTAVGKLQVARHSRASPGKTARIFDNEQDAITYLLNTSSGG